VRAQVRGDTCGERKALLVAECSKRDTEWGDTCGERKALLVAECSERDTEYGGQGPIR
jgi:hypothetical protein